MSETLSPIEIAFGEALADVANQLITQHSAVFNEHDKNTKREHVTRATFALFVKSFEAKGLSFVFTPKT